jgi:hypothetical protein
MPLYYGIPVCIEEACNIFRLNIEDITEKAIKKYKISENERAYFYTMQCVLADYLNFYLNSKNIKIKLLSTDKGQYIIGYEITEISVFKYEFINSDQFILKLNNLKLQFMEEMEYINANLTIVTLEHLEDVPEIVNNPIPYVILF